MTNGLKGGIAFEPVEVRPDQIFKPAVERVEVVLRPAPEDVPLYPPFEPYEPLPSPDTYKAALPSPVTKSVVLNIETTGLMPFDSRITHIAAISLENPEQIINFFDEDERKIVQQFSDWFEANDFNEIIGFNASFDYRFIFTKGMRYSIPMPGFYDARIWDVANSMKQVKQEFVFGFNKIGTLDEWAFYLLGLKPPITQLQAIQAFADKEYDKIADYNRYKVHATLGLWALTKLTTGELSVS